jgi:hypothetical protein
MQMRSVWLAVEVQVPEGLGDEAMAGFLSKFIDVGSADLYDTVNDCCLEHTEEDQLGLSAQWFNPIVLPGRPG